MSIRGIKRTFGVCYQTVMVWAGEKSGRLPAFEDTLLPSQNGDVLELAELWNFVEKKTQQVWLAIFLSPATISKSSGDQRPVKYYSNIQGVLTFSRRKVLRRVVGIARRRICTVPVTATTVDVPDDGVQVSRSVDCSTRKLTSVAAESRS